MFTFDLKDTCCSFFLSSLTKFLHTKGSLGKKCFINFCQDMVVFFFSFSNNIAVLFIAFFVLILISTSIIISRRTWKSLFFCVEPDVGALH